MRSPPKPPDLKPISDAQLELGRQSTELAREQLGLSREQFAFFRDQSATELEFAREQASAMLGLQGRSIAAGEAANAISGRVAESQIGLMDQARDFAGRDRARYERTFIPLQDRFISDAEAFDTEARREMEAGRAMVDVQRQAEAQRTNADARLSSMGLDPSQFRSASISSMIGAQTAAAGALQGNNARRGVEDKGRALRADAINLGMGLPAQATQSIGVASGAGANASNAAAQGAGSAMGGYGQAAGMASGAANLRSGALGQMGALTGSPMQWAQMGSGNMGQAGNMFNNAGSTMTQNFSNQMTRHNAQQQQISGMMSMAGGVMGMFAGGGAVPSRAHLASGGVPSLDEMGMGLQRDTLEVDRGYLRDPGRGLAPKAKAKPSLGERFSAGMDRFEAGRSRFGEPQEYNTEVQQILRPVAMAGGGRVRGALPVRQVRDMIPAMLSEGEYVIPADVHRAVGTEKLDKLVAKYHREGS